MYDFILCNVPKSDVYSPIIGLPILKSVLNENSYSSKILDFNIELYQCYKEIFNVDEWVDLDILFKQPILDNTLYTNLLDEWTDVIIQHNPKYVGFSAFSGHNFYPIKAFTKLIREKNPDIKIVIGGPMTIWIYERMFNENLIDYSVIGYGEEAILKILNNESFVGINDGESCRRIDLNKSPFPDFSDLDLSKYMSGDKLYTYSSRGCTQHCSFCDVNDIWNGFNTRDPIRVVEEMIIGSQKYGVTKFEFCDSLINGNLSNMRGICNELIYYNFKWDGMFRIRNMMDTDYMLLKHAGCTLLKIGIESGDLEVRNHMGKYFSNDDIFKTLDNLKNVNLQCDLFFVTGYPTETEKAFLESKELIKQFYDRGYENIISNIRIQPLEIHRSPLKSLKDSAAQDKRYLRYYELRQHTLDVGFSIRRDKKMKLLVKEYQYNR